jgi:type III pantothenate kinase
MADARRPGSFLAIDIGNTNVAVALFRGETIADTWRLSSFTSRTGDEIALILRGLLQEHVAEIARDGAIGLASVVPQLTDPLSEACRRLVGHDPVVLSAEVDHGVRVHYVDPSQIGPDRLCNVAAVNDAYRVPAIVVDLGTTTNFDVIGPDGAFEGGAIAPGFFSSAEELFRRAARLPRVELVAPKSAIGRTTEEAIRSGVLYGTVGQIDGIVTRLRDEVEGDPLVIATGGLASTIVKESATIEIADPALTLKGVRCIGLRLLARRA